ncbi:MAG: gamma-glutamyl-gamma-aminobutyrate hydrolase family protein [Gammaproteobacteria bacterium]|nr:gamma-glutamyl-gamma-aminobutyrate hydrolase family protein [Gammaproteobacteria bacterium]
MAGSARRPLIGVTGPRRGALGPRACIHLGVLLAGGNAVQLRPDDAGAAPQLDGVVISGGHDVEPVLYKSAAKVTGNYDPERDRFEVGVIEQALREDRPLLGICRGAQLLNVVMGGNLNQDLRAIREKTSNRRTLLPLKTLLVEAGTVLHDVLAANTLKINSLHNQSINRVGDRLRIAARDLDDIVQAVENPTARFLVGVQWHPEFLLYAARQRALFRHLVAAAAPRP